MVITTDEFLTQGDIAWDGYAAIAQELGEDLINARPDVVGANTAYGVIAHVVGVAGGGPARSTSASSSRATGIRGTVIQPASGPAAPVLWCCPPARLRELAQHLGQLEVIRDVLLARPARP